MFLFAYVSKFATFSYHSKMPNDFYGCIPEFVVFVVWKGLRRRHNHTLACVDSERIDIFHVAYCYAIVVCIADNFVLDLNKECFLCIAEIQITYLFPSFEWFILKLITIINRRYILKGKTGEYSRVQVLNARALSRVYDRRQNYIRKAQLWWY